MLVCPSMPMPTMEILAATLNRLSLYYNYFQIDIGDGIYVPNRTVQIDDIANNYQSIDNFENLVLDFHLMVKHYEEDIAKLAKLKNNLNIGKIFVHFGLNPDIKNLRKQYGFPVGPVLNFEDKVSDLKIANPPETVDFLQIMSISPGPQGNPFIPESLIKIEQLRKAGYESKIFLDGAVNDQTLPYINALKYKPDVICPGSFLCKPTGEELKKRVVYLEKMSS